MAVPCEASRRLEPEGSGGELDLSWRCSPFQRQPIAQEWLAAFVHEGNKVAQATGLAVELASQIAAQGDVKIDLIA